MSCEVATVIALIAGVALGAAVPAGYYAGRTAGWQRELEELRTDIAILRERAQL